jgi:hypothetical protein
MSGSLRLRRDYGEETPFREGVSNLPTGLEDTRALLENVITRKLASPKFTIEELFTKFPETFPIPWGNPPKPNLWRVKKISDHTFQKNSLRVYRIETDLFIDPQEYLEIVVAYFSEDKIYRLEVLKGLIRLGYLWVSGSTSLEGPLKKLWLDTKHKITPLLKVNKVASSNLSVGDLFDQPINIFPLPWGSPPKPNLWKVERSAFASNDRVSYMVKTPLLKKESTQLVLSFRKVAELYVIIEVRLDWDRLVSFNTQVGSNLSRALEIIWHDIKTPLASKLSVNKIASASGHYGYTKKVQLDCESAINQLRKYCTSLCSKQKTKGNAHLEFYKKYAEKTENPFAKALVQCNRDIYTEALNKIASSMFGYDERVVKLCLNSMTDVQMRSAMIINRLLARKTSNTEQIKAYLKEHIDQTGCVWSICLNACI